MLWTAGWSTTRHSPRRAVDDTARGACRLSTTLLSFSSSVQRRRLGLVSFRLCHALLDFSAAVRALVDEVELRHAPMGRHASYVTQTPSQLGQAIKADSVW